MKKIFTFLSVAAISAGLTAQETTTLSQTNDLEVPGTTGILSCNDNDNAIMRLFNLNDYGITSFEVTSVDAAAIIWNGGYAEATIWNIPGPDYPESIPADMFEDTGFYAFYSNNSGDRVWDWVNFEVFDEASTPITSEKQFAVVITGPISNADAGWAESYVPLPSDGGFIKSSYFGAPTSGCYAVEEDTSTRLDVAGFGDPYGATLLTVTGVAQGMGLVSLESRALSVYPNPATDVINVKMGDNKTVQSVEIVNLAGQSVYKAGSVDAVNINFLANGVYVLRVKDNAGVTHMTKIMKK